MIFLMEIILKNYLFKIIILNKQKRAKKVKKSISRRKLVVFAKIDKKGDFIYKLSLFTTLEGLKKESFIYRFNSDNNRTNNYLFEKVKKW